MAFKGEIAIGANVDIKFSSDFSNGGTAILTAGAGEAPSKATSIAPGTSDTIRLSKVKVGILRIVVDVKEDDDSGRLEVKENGNIKNDEAIMGDTSWAYSVA